MGGVKEQPVNDVDLLGVVLWSGDSVTKRLVFKSPVWKNLKVTRIKISFMYLWALCEAEVTFYTLDLYTQYWLNYHDQ